MRGLMREWIALVLAMDTGNTQSVKRLAGVEFQTVSNTMLDGLLQEILAQVTQTAVKQGSIKRQELCSRCRQCSLKWRR
jgi:hypothetical protein